MKYVFAVISGLIGLSFLWTAALVFFQFSPFAIIMLVFAGGSFFVGARALGFGQPKMLGTPESRSLPARGSYRHIIQPLARFAMYVLAVSAVGLLLGGGTLTLGAMLIAFFSVSLITGIVFLAIGFGRDDPKQIEKHSKALPPSSILRGDSEPKPEHPQ